MSNKENKKEKDKNKLKKPFIQFTTLRRFTILILAFVVAYLPKTLPLSMMYRAIIIGTLLVIWIFFETASLRISFARKNITKGKKDKGWKGFKSVIKTPVVPLSSDEKLFLATVFIQHSDEPEFGIKFLEKWLSKTKNRYNIVRATNSLALGYYRIGNIDKAIELTEKLYTDGIEDVSLLINYSTFLLKKGECEKAFDIIVKGGNNIYILDNLGVYYLMNDMHSQAIDLYRQVLDNMQPHFVEFYIHTFQSELYYQVKEKARDALHTALTCPRVLTTTFDKEYIDNLAKEMENSSGMAKINASATEIAFGKEWRNTTKEYVSPSKEDIDKYNRNPYDEDN